MLCKPWIDSVQLVCTCIHIHVCAGICGSQRLTLVSSSIVLFYSLRHGLLLNLELTFQPNYAANESQVFSPMCIWAVVAGFLHRYWESKIWITRSLCFYRKYVTDCPTSPVPNPPKKRRRRNTSPKRFIHYRFSAYLPTCLRRFPFQNKLSQW